METYVACCNLARDFGRSTEKNKKTVKARYLFIYLAWAVPNTTQGLTRHKFCKKQVIAFRNVTFPPYPLPFFFFASSSTYNAKFLALCCVNSNSRIVRVLFFTSNTKPATQILRTRQIHRNHRYTDNSWQRTNQKSSFPVENLKNFIASTSTDIYCKAGTNRDTTKYQTTDKSEMNRRIHATCDWASGKRGITHCLKHF